MWEPGSVAEGGSDGAGSTGSQGESSTDCSFGSTRNVDGQAHCRGCGSTAPVSMPHVEVVLARLMRAALQGHRGSKSPTAPVTLAIAYCGLDYVPPTPPRSQIGRRPTDHTDGRGVGFDHRLVIERMAAGPVDKTGTRNFFWRVIVQLPMEARPASRPRSARRGRGPPAAGKSASPCLPLPLAAGLGRRGWGGGSSFGARREADGWPD